MKILLTLALLLCGQQIGQRSFMPPSSGCTVQADQQTGTNNESNIVANSTGSTYGAFSFVAGSSYTLCAVTVPLEKVGSPTFTLNVYLYTNGSSAPGTLIGTGSASVNTSTLSTSYSNINFTGLSASVTNGTTYWIVIKATSAPDDFTNYVQWGGTGTGATCYNISTAGSSWSCNNPNVQGILTTYHS